MENFLTKNPQENKINDNNIKEEFKLENESHRLSLRKNKINGIISSKRKLVFEKSVNDKTKSQYFIDVNNIDIPNDKKIDISYFLNHVSTFYLFILN